MNCRPSPEIRLLIGNSSPFPGCITEASNKLNAQDITIIKNASPRNSSNGSGNLLPTRSTTSRNFLKTPFFSVLSVNENPPIIYYFVFPDIIKFSYKQDIKSLHKFLLIVHAIFLQTTT